jgi:protein ImuA
MSDMEHMGNNYSIESASQICALRRTIARIEQRGDAGNREAVRPASLGPVLLDAAISGGLVRGRLHEVFAMELADSGSATGFAAILAGLVSPAGAPLFWLREEAAERAACLHAPGLVEIGIDPQRMVLVVLPDPATLLRTAADVVRCAAVGAVVIELWRRPRALDLTATRRLALAAEQSGVTPLLLRIAAEPGPSAAQTRWSACAAPSVALATEAPGRPAFTVELLRQRGRPDGGLWYLEWDRDRSCFRDATLSGAVVPAAGQRSLAGDAWHQTGLRAG